MRGKGKKEEVPIEPPKPVITPLQKIQFMLSFNKNYGELDEIGTNQPFFRFIPVRKEIVQRLIIRACFAKNDKDFI